MWLAVVTLALGTVAITTFIARHARRAAAPRLGWMSEGWLVQHRVGSR